MKYKVKNLAPQFLSSQICYKFETCSSESLWQVKKINTTFFSFLMSSKYWFLVCEMYNDVILYLYQGLPFLNFQVNLICRSLDLSWRNTYPLRTPHREPFPKLNFASIIVAHISRNTVDFRFDCSLNFFIQLIPRIESMIIFKVQLLENIIRILPHQIACRKTSTISFIPVRITPANFSGFKVTI